MEEQVVNSTLINPHTFAKPKFFGNLKDKNTKRTKKTKKGQLQEKLFLFEMESIFNKSICYKKEKDPKRQLEKKWLGIQ